MNGKTKGVPAKKDVGKAVQFCPNYNLLILYKNA